MKYQTYSVSIALLLLPFSCPSGGSESTEARDVDYFCARISHINQMPNKIGLSTDDLIYNGLVGFGIKSTPCLVEAVTDGTQIQDPRSTPGPPSTIAVGDLAFFIWLRITGVGMEEVLPQDVAEDYEKNGVFAYFSFIHVPGNRRILQERLRNWHKVKKDF